MRVSSFVQCVVLVCQLQAQKKPAPKPSIPSKAGAKKPATPTQRNEPKPEPKKTSFLDGTYSSYQDNSEQGAGFYVSQTYTVSGDEVRGIYKKKDQNGEQAKGFVGKFVFWPPGDMTPNDDVHIVAHIAGRFLNNPKDINLPISTGGIGLDTSPDAMENTMAACTIEINDQGKYELWAVNNANTAIVSGIKQDSKKVVGDEECKWCDSIANQCLPTEKDEAVSLCHMLIGALWELGNYKAAFMKEPDFINLFPAIYYNVTKDEMDRLANKEFSKPLPHMKLMLAFFDAYKQNRINYEAGGNEEPQWRTYYLAARKADADLDSIVSSIPIKLPVTALDVLTAGINAHVNYDLPRSIRFIYEKEKPSEDEFSDFLLSNETLKSTSSQSTNDIYDALLKSRWYRKYPNILAQPGIMRAFDQYVSGNTEEVIKGRENAWKIALANGGLLTGNRSQPITHHSILESEGKQHCKEYSN